MVKTLIGNIRGPQGEVGPAGKTMYLHKIYFTDLGNNRLYINITCSQSQPFTFDTFTNINACLGDRNIAFNLNGTTKILVIGKISWNDNYWVVDDYLTGDAYDTITGLSDTVVER